MGFSNNLCEEIVNTVFSNILEIAKKQKLTLKNFGSFEVKQKNLRPGINFHTKSSVIIESKKNLRFVPSSKLPLEASYAKSLTKNIILLMILIYFKNLAAKRVIRRLTWKRARSL